MRLGQDMIDMVNNRLKHFLQKQGDNILAICDNSQGRDLRSTKDTLDLETHIAISIIFEKPHSVARPEGKIKEN